MEEGDRTDSRKDAGFFGIFDRGLRLFEGVNTFMTNVIIIAFVIALCFGGWKVYQTVSWIWDFGGKATEVVSQAVDSAQEGVSQAVDVGLQKVDAAGDSASAVLDASTDLIVDGTEAIVDGAGEIGNTVVDTVQDTGTAVKDATGSIKNTVDGIVEQGGDVAKNAIEGASNALSDRTLVSISDQEAFNGIAAIAFDQVVSTLQSASLGFVNNKLYLAGSKGRICQITYAEGKVAMIAADQDAFAQGKAVDAEPQKVLRWALLGEDREVLMGFNILLDPELGTWGLHWNQTTITKGLSDEDVVQAAKTVLQATSSCAGGDSWDIEIYLRDETTRKEAIPRVASFEYVISNRRDSFIYHKYHDIES